MLIGLAWLLAIGHREFGVAHAIVWNALARVVACWHGFHLVCCCWHVLKVVNRTTYTLDGSFWGDLVMIHSYKVSILSVYVFICNYSLSIISFSYYTFLFIFLYKKSLYITFHVVIKLLYINFHYYTLPYTHYTFSFSLTKLCLYKHIFLNPEPPTLCETTTSI